MSIYDLTCPKCGSECAYIIVEDADSWMAVCDDCGHYEHFDLDNLIPQMFPQWMKPNAKQTLINRLAQKASENWHLYFKQLEHNSQLRELCADMYVFHNGGCFECRYRAECKERATFECIAPKRINERARALGIEVGA